MKKIISICMVITALLVFSACSHNTKNESNTQTATSQSQTTSDEATEDKNDEKNTSAKTLIVYFSASNNTKNAAQYIASTTNGDLFEIVPKIIYTDDDLNWRDENSRVNYEHNNEKARNIELISSTVDNWESYDIVFIGYPIWWGIAAWPVNTFIKSNDFTGKTVIPFCTSTSSGLGESSELLEQMTGTGNWLEGKRFSESASQSELQEWLDNLDI